MNPSSMMRFKQRDFIWVHDFDETFLEYFIEDFMRLEQDPAIQVIAMYISSYGGDTYTLTAMRDMMKSSVKPVATICMGKAMSAGAFLLAAGTPGLRFCSENADIMVHESSSGAVGKTAEVLQYALDLDKFNKRVMKNFAQDIGKSVAELESILKERSNVDWYLNSKDAKKVGIIDHIGIPRVGHIPELVMLATPPGLEVHRVKKPRAKKPNIKK
jgi:ATP-dependent Clp protease protease subunit